MAEADIPKYHKNGSRRAFIKQHIGQPAKALEIGALNSPVFGKDSTHVRYADWCDTDQLIQNYPHKKNIMNVDYVLSDSDFSKQIGETFDCVVANHVFEHIPDPINWLAEISNLTRPGGWLMMAVPDKRYTFDIIRNTSNLADFLDCAYRQLEHPSVSQIFSHLYYYRKVTAEDVWGGRTVDLATPRFGVAKAVKSALSMSESYHSVHCHVFTCESFVELFRDLEQTELVEWKLHAFQEPLPGSNEFLVALKRM